MHEQLIGGLRAMADHLEKSPLPDEPVLDVALTFFCRDKETLAAAVKSLGACSKRSDGRYITAQKRFGRGVCIDVVVQQEKCCERILLKEVVVPAKPERILPAEPEKVEQIFGWKCPPLLAGENGSEEPEVTEEVNAMSD